MKTLFLHFTRNIEGAKEDLTDPIDPTMVITMLERDFFLAGYYKAFVLGAGPCRLCAECTVKECRHPETAGYHFEVLKVLSSQINRFGLVLIE